MDRKDMRSSSALAVPFTMVQLCSREDTIQWLNATRYSSFIHVGFTSWPAVP